MAAIQGLRAQRAQIGGVIGAGFFPGVSGNPGGRPKGLARRVRELVGDDGHVIVEYMFSVMSDEASRTADRLHAARWLADRGFGKAVQTMDVGPTRDLLHAFLSSLSGDELDTMLAILEKHEPAAPRLALSPTT